jgi:hypothetical protein
MTFTVPYASGRKSNVNENKIEIEGGTGIEDVYGGYTYTGTVSSNTVIQLRT